MNSSHWFHMNIMITFLPKGFMKHSYQIHENFMTIFITKWSWKCPNERLPLISYEYHDHISTERVHETFISNSRKFHDNFYYEISMEISKWTAPIDFIWISWSYFYRKGSWNIHIKFIKISWLVLLCNKHENIQMNYSHWFHMIIIIIFIPKGFMKHSYQIHENFMSVFILK